MHLPIKLPCLPVSKIRYTSAMYVIIILWSICVGGAFCIRFFSRMPNYFLILFPFVVGYAGYILYWDYSLLPVAYEQRMDLTWLIIMWFSSLLLFLRVCVSARFKRIYFFAGTGALLISSIIAFFEKEPGNIIFLVPILSFVLGTILSYCIFLFRKYKGDW